MIKKPLWVKRTFSLDLPTEMLLNIIERLRGTPARLEELVASTPADQVKLQFENSWSIQQIAGHLIDVEELWLKRLDDFADKLEKLRPADMSNAKTEGASHNENSLRIILADFRRERMIYVARLEDLTDDDAKRQAFHPRLEVTMRPVDLALFSAEHDDHHLARISELNKMLR